MSALLLGALCVVSGALVRAEQAGDPQAPCLDCHTASSDVPVHAIDGTVHRDLERGGDANCRACHGDSAAHIAASDREAPDVSYGPRWFSEPATRSASCLVCHENVGRLLWTGSHHERESLTCDNCHGTHLQRDPALDDKQSGEICLNCHQQVRAEIRLPSRHPIAEGKTACADCHNSCHQEKRGPFLWEHPPVAEDCSLCHRPHGSVNDRLLTARGPALCQQCHAAAFHPSQPYGGEGLPGGNANPYLLGKNCLNCHSQAHGSNHPSGARLTR
jgi:predicted CXXCH cytochrome family protein